MFAQKQRPGIAIAGYFVSEPALKRERSLEVDRTQQVNAERPLDSFVNRLNQRLRLHVASRQQGLTNDCP